MSRLTRQYLRIPRPKNLFGVINLQTATELISLALVFNKVTGVYGLLAILTGYQLSLLQLSTYIYSILMLVCLAYLIPHIRKQSPLECLGLAWIYALDTIINGAYAAAFAVAWCVGGARSGAPGGQENGMVVENLDSLKKQSAQNGDIMPQETAASMVMVVCLTLVRIHFSLVIMAFARQTLHRYMQRVDMEDGGDGPFAVGMPEGEGRRGRLGRLMVSVGRIYWLGGAAEESEAAGKGWKGGQGGMLAREG